MAQKIQTNQLENWVITPGNSQYYGTNSGWTKWFFPLSSVTTSFWWDGSDWALDWTVDITIAGTNDTYIVKNYSSIAAWVAPRILTITPTGCVLHIKVQGNADLTNWTFNFAGKGWQWGAAAVAIAGPGWVWGAMDNNPLKASWGSSAYAGGESTWGTLALTTNYYRAYPGNIFQLAYVWWAGGGGWAGSQTIANLTGNGWNWGGCVILEIAGNVTFNTTTFNMAGTDGAAWLNQWPGQEYWSWGGWGGWGGAFIYYQGTLTGAPTNTLTGWAWAASIAAAWATGTPGQPWSGWAWAWAAWGNSVGHIFAVWWDTGAGWVGWVWLAVLKKVNTF